MLNFILFSHVGCSKAKLWRKALHFLDEMRTMGVTPNEYTYSAAISACGNGGKWEKALDLLNEVRFSLKML